MWEKIAQVWRLGWDAHPSLLVVVLVVVAAYVIAARRVSRPAADRLTLRHATLFALGILTLLLTLNSPLHHLSDEYLFSAHMVQHLLLTLVVPPLILLGIPGWMGRPLLARPWLARFGRTKAYLLLSFGVFNLLFALAHFPVIYDALFGPELVHRLTHVVLLLAALAT